MSDLRKQIPNIETDLEEQATGALYQVIKEFNARLEDELSLRLGDKIEVIADDREYNDGWYMGKSLSTAQIGLYPKSFTQLVPSLSRPSLLRSRSRRIASSTSSSANQSPISSSNLIPGFNKSASTTPTTNKTFSKFENELPETQTIEPQKKHSVVNNALSDIDKALEELRNEAELNSSTKDLGSDRVSTISLNPEDVETWSAEQVTQYFSSLGFDQHSSDQFLIHKITGAILIELELAYLKELDISSFGTRFEIFKEIEALKELAVSSQTTLQYPYDSNSSVQQNQQTSSLLAPPEVTRRNNGPSVDRDLESLTRPLVNHQRKKSRSLDDIPELGSKAPITTQFRQSSLSNTASSQSRSSRPPNFNVPELPRITSPSPTREQFVSPRRAPNPPSFPSPVQLHPERFSNQVTPTSNRNSLYDTTTHSRKPSYDINPSFAFNSKSIHSRKPSNDHSRNNSRNIKSLSVIDISPSHNHELNRPASSIYLDSNSHSRKSSAQFTKASNGHSRGLSDASILKSAKEENQHRRHSSVFSFLSNSNAFGAGTGIISPSRKSPTRPSSVIFTEEDIFEKKRDSPSRSTTFSRRSEVKLTDIPTLDPNAKRRSVSAKESQPPNNEVTENEVHTTSASKRSVSEAVRNKTLRNISSSNTLKRNNKKETSAFMEGIKNISPGESIKNAEAHGWMKKKGGIAVGTWKQRYFVLHGTRLSYFANSDDTRERGLIDITSHKVLPAKEDDKLVALYAATTGNGKFCFKLVPPAPGSKKGLTFTQPKVHYFAVETKEEMRYWMASLIKATIDIDESLPVLSSCATPTVSLQKAQILLQQARASARRRELEYATQDQSGNTSSISPIDTDSFDSSNLPPNSQTSPSTTINTGDATTPIISESNGFSSPFDIAGFAITPKSPKVDTSGNSSPVDEFKAKPYNAGALRHPSTRVVSSASAAAAAQAALKHANGKM
ncbi:hypothetical protein WICMUC_003316 [Wickerhamomyces mucosus]|uniref:Protein BOI2 n=1 Tax=Wickerhamomyces mucosus TaxID=1378264 RepID=A0A9P8TCJ4_9ASCO|nr:hypothetical protein WICMUC_003316 [Wickerhamomyces mucosus]